MYDKEEVKYTMNGGDPVTPLEVTYAVDEETKIRSCSADAIPIGGGEGGMFEINGLKSVIESLLRDNIGSYAECTSKEDSVAIIVYSSEKTALASYEFNKYGYATNYLMQGYLIHVDYTGAPHEKKA